MPIRQEKKLEQKSDVDNTSVRLVQITDCHLAQQPGGRLLGVDTDFSLELILALLQQQQPQMQRLIVTGDIANDAGHEAYQRLQEKLAVLPVPSQWLPGNHDQWAIMQQVVGDSHEIDKSLTLGNWQLLFLDSTCPGEVGGSLRDEEIERIERSLQQHPDAPHLIFMHHPLMPIHTAWLDDQRIDNADAVLAKFANHPQIKAISCGHIHQEVDECHSGLRLLATPSTCIQFKRGPDDFCLDPIMPGYRWFDLYPDGSLITGVERLPEQDLNVDFQTKGY